MTAFWVVAALVTLATLALVLTPLVRRQGRMAPRRAEFDLRIYRDQLAEVDRDVERRLLGTDEAEAARIEIKRRMLAAADRDRFSSPPPSIRRAGAGPAAVMAVALSIGALGLYLMLGAPNIPDQPLALRGKSMDGAGSSRGLTSMEEAVARLAHRLETNPDDIAGWSLLGRSYFAMERYAEAAEAFRRALALDPNRSEVAADYGEALVAAAQGQITDEAREAFRRASNFDPRNPKARFYLAADKVQQGDLNGALQAWVDLIALSPPDAPWLAAARQQMTQAAAAFGVDPATVKPSPQALALVQDAPFPIPSQKDVEAAARMSEQERAAMIRSMVGRLAARLEKEPNDREGWLRLAQAYDVLGERDKARDARARAEALKVR